MDAAGSANETSGADDGIVLLTVVTPKNSVLTKTLARLNGKWKVARDYGGITRVTAREVPVRDISSLRDILMVAARDPKMCAIRGGIRRGFEKTALRPDGVRRLAYDRPDEIAGISVFEERARFWLAADLDSFPLPPHIDPVVDIEHVIDAAIEKLPSEFHTVSCFYQLTSGHGIKPGGRARLFFWLSRRVTNEEAKQWLPSSIADPSVHAIVQPIYIAAPIFPAGVRDFLSRRCGLHLGSDDEVQVPDLVAWSRNSGYGAAHGETIDAESVDEALDMMGDPPDYPKGRGFHGPIGAALKVATREFGSDLNQEALLAQVEAKLRERVGRRGDAYLNRRIRDARPWLIWLIKKTAEREARGPTVAPPGHGLGSYYSGPTESREDALARQDAAIRKVIELAGRNADIRRRVRAAIKSDIEGL